MCLSHPSLPYRYLFHPPGGLIAPLHPLVNPDSLPQQEEQAQLSSPVVSQCVNRDESNAPENVILLEFLRL